MMRNCFLHLILLHAEMEEIENAIILSMRINNVRLAESSENGATTPVGLSISDNLLRREEN